MFFYKIVVTREYELNSLSILLPFIHMLIYRITKAGIKSLSSHQSFLVIISIFQ